MDYCRICARNDRNPLVSILDKNPLNIQEKISKLLGINVIEENPLPHSICLDCLSKLNHFNEFFMACLENQIILEIIFGVNGEKSNSEESKKVTEKVEEVNHETSNVVVIEDVQVAGEAKEDQNISFDEYEVVLDDSDYPTLDCTKNTKIRKFHRFDCYLCSKRFDGNQKFVRHFKEFHPNDELHYKCFICSNTVKTYRSYTRHLESHTTDKQFSCDACSRSFSQKITLIQHLNSHRDLKTYKCDECDSYFKHNASLFKHRKQKHSKEIPSCIECKKSFVSKETLRQHMRSKHTMEKNILCSMCSKTFSSRSALIYHQKSQHQSSENNRNICDICEKKFQTHQILLRHKMIVHHKKEVLEIK
ncbi:CLUMA_CG004818, isoform A [Clunio marinus]|uniref:CLUMA_CG004818, isoform A n=1 Tax=Clunio marinus TaxID=568069 RepID=A0A1J1HT08_9DIPT|nr:CLUMA_CG004818, isoform A [Clunio marinus]